MIRLFTEHPSTVGETYFQHFRAASRFGVAMIVGGLACLVHAVFPWVCEKSGSSMIRRLYRAMVTNRADLARLDEVEDSFDWVI
ncbi:DUF6356 family protein [Aurantiacibacter sp. MUD11]|uniref:DUF6356 family protein n=1 Tax=Aurantiacibacter sp. MUD11 TaxID=3003265 RepID=UPI0022AAB275|nr:DUF6356 family protein [Aurantiacibacter sp. MUD11]WAT19283.1 DUF6356 family protein [Aurantiacibacter sp. MUD11]